MLVYLAYLQAALNVSRVDHWARWDLAYITTDLCFLIVIDFVVVVARVGDFLEWELNRPGSRSGALDKPKGIIECLNA